VDQILLSRAHGSHDLLAREREGDENRIFAGMGQSVAAVDKLLN
jgi:hypothetical protein